MSVAFAMWSGDKDSHYALYRAKQAGLDCQQLVTFIDADTELVLAHRVPPELIEEQAQLMEIPLLKIRATYATYERELRNALFDLRCDGITRGIFGDIAMRDHREWFEQVLSDFDMRAVFPLWGIPSHHLIEEQRRIMKSVIIQLERKVSEVYLGHELTTEFAEYMAENGWDASGEGGEYHTFVCRSPLMNGEIILTHGERRATPQTVGVEVDFWKVERCSTGTQW